MARSTELSRYRWLPVPRRHHYGVGEETLLLSWFMSSSGLQLLGITSIASDLPTGQGKIACYVLLRRYPHQTHPYWPKPEDEEASHC